MRRFIIGFCVLMAFDTLAQLSFKVAATHAMPLDFSAAWCLRLFAEPWIYGAVLGYTGAFVTWMTILKRAPVGPSFAASHLELVSVTLFSVWLLGEELNIHTITGGALILLGVLCLAKSEAGEEDRAERV